MASECYACGETFAGGPSRCGRRICSKCWADPTVAVDWLCDKIDTRAARLDKLEAFVRRLAQWAVGDADALLAALANETEDEGEHG